MVFAGLKPDVTSDLDLSVHEPTYRALFDARFEEDKDERGCRASWSRRPSRS
jgi:hypothetical protein